MKKHDLPKHPDHLKTLFLFLFITTFLILIGLCFKIVLVVQQNKFDGVHQFNLGFVQDATHLQIVSIDPTSKSVSLVTIVSDKATDDLTRIVGIPLDVKMTTSDILDQNKSLPLQLVSLLHHPGQWQGEMTFVDVIRLALAAKSTDNSTIKKQTIQLPMSEDVLDPLLARLFADGTIVEENKSIGISNGTDIPGLGTNLERSLLHIGGNVTSVTTARTTEQTSKIYYYGDLSYTAERLSKLLRFPLQHVDQQSISDIMIVIGRDHTSSTLY